MNLSLPASIPYAARYAGIDTGRRILLAAGMAGGLGSLAGMVEVLGVQHRLMDGLSGGVGFVGIIVALLARLNPLAVLPTALLYGGMTVGADAMQRRANIPSSITFILQSLIVLLVLASSMLLRYRINIRRATPRADRTASGACAMNLHTFLSSAFLVTWLAASIRLAGPILLAALGETFAERSGVLNVGIEGTVLLGALASFLTFDRDRLALGILLGAMLVGILASLFLAWMYVTVRTSQVVVGLVFNVLAVGVAATVYRRAMGRSADPESITMFQPVHLGWLSTLPIIGPILFGQTIPLYLTLALVVVAQVVLFRTRFGLGLCASGENPKAADAAGVSVTHAIRRRPHLRRNRRPCRRLPGARADRPLSRVHRLRPGLHRSRHRHLRPLDAMEGRACRLHLWCLRRPATLAAAARYEGLPRSFCWRFPTSSPSSPSQA
jgi:ABC-type uncharacterized transport system permease subunit